ncbi:acetate--CoA ligase family protein [Candidatus Bathyarchaeota archaeon]|nr:acetate--CoA ligase family protein [Candidatus Bathyarchaeota archaeon]
MNIRARQIIDKAFSEQRSSLDTLESLRFLESYDLPVVTYLPVNSLAEAEIAAQRIEYPLVVKQSFW